MNHAKLDELEDMLYECRSLIQEARHSEFERRLAAFNLKHPKVLECPAIKQAYLNNVQRHTDKRDAQLKEAAEKWGSITHIFTKGAFCFEDVPQLDDAPVLDEIEEAFTIE